MATLSQTAQAYEPESYKNIADLPYVSTDAEVGGEKKINSAGEDYVVQFIEVNGEKYRVPNSVLSNLKVILEENPNLKTFKVKKTGSGLDTKYTVITLS